MSTQVNQSKTMLRLTESETPSSPNDYTHSKKDSRMKGHRSNIALNACIAILPMSIFSSFIIYLVFRYRLRPSAAPFEDLQLTRMGEEGGVYYINLRATYLIFVASWSSSLSSILAAPLMALISYPIAKGNAKAACLNQVSQLLTPYQLVLTINMLNGGGIGSLWSWYKYLWGWRKQRQPQGKPLTSAASVLILVTLLSFFVFLADTWLHVTTTTVNFVQVVPSSQNLMYSFGLSEKCTIGNNSFGGQMFNNACTINVAATNVFLLRPSVALQVLSEVSDSIEVSTYYGERAYAYLTPPTTSLASTDFTASTFGVSTQCMPISRMCSLNGFTGAATPFSCTPAFSGDVTYNNWIEGYFTNASMTDNYTSHGINNPYYFGIAALVNSQGGGTLDQGNVPDITRPVHGGTSFVLACNTTVYDVEYDFVNGSATRFVVTISNDSTTNIMQVTIANTKAARLSLIQAANLATFSSSAQELADKIALEYSRAGLALFAGATVPRYTIKAQERTASLVTRLPVAPLMALIVANLLLVLLGLVFTYRAYSSLRDEAVEVQVRCSVAGIVADRFESTRSKQRVNEVQDLFTEKEGKGSIRVAVTGVGEGGYAYEEWLLA